MSSPNSLGITCPSVAAIKSHPKTVEYVDKEGRSYYYNEMLELPLRYFIDFGIIKTNTVTMICKGLLMKGDLTRDRHRKQGDFITLSKVKRKKRKSQLIVDGEEKEMDAVSPVEVAPDQLTVGIEHIVQEKRTVKRVSIMVLYLVTDKSRVDWLSFKSGKY